MNKLVTSLRDLGHQLVETRLWPIALALAVALVAAPVLLSNPPQETASTAPPAAPSVGAGPGGTGGPFVAFTPAVSSTGKKSSEIHKQLQGFRTKNPFTPRGDQTGIVAASGAGDAQPLGGGATVTTGTSTGDTSATTPTAGTGTGTGTGTGSTGADKTFYTYTADVRFGEAGEVKTKTLERFRALPSSDNPIVIFMGVKTDGKTAVFMVSSETTTTGDGTCKPSESSCLFLYMQKGDEQTIEAIDADGNITTYQLELRDINVEELNKAGAKGARARGSEAATPRAHSSRRLRPAERRARARYRRVMGSFDTVGF